MCDELLSFVHESPLKSVTKLSRLGFEVLREAEMQGFGIAIFVAGVAVAAISMKLIHLKENLEKPLEMNTMNSGRNVQSLYHLNGTAMVGFIVLRFKNFR